MKKSESRAAQLRVKAARENQLAKWRLRYWLDDQLRSSPPQFSEIKDLRISNGYSNYDENGNLTYSWLAIQSMTDLNRFARGRKTINELSSSEECYFREYRATLKSYARDFYEAWHISSSEIIHWLGIHETCRILAMLKASFQITWPSDVVDILRGNEGGFPTSVQVFRGESASLPDRAKCAGFSWTRSLDVAKYYAQRFSDGVVYEGWVNFDKIFVMHRREMEVVVIPGTVSVDSCTKVSPRLTTGRIGIPNVEHFY